MKKLILFILLCFGVGMTMMGSPAQLSDDDNSQVVSNSGSNGSVTVVPENFQKPIHGSNGRFKYEVSKKIDISKFSTPKIMKRVSNGKHENQLTKCEDKSNRLSELVDDPIIIGPIEPNGGNGGQHFSSFLVAPRLQKID